MIKIMNVSKKFGANVIFHDLNLEIKTGELVAITGNSGCGKTTLLNMIGLIDNNYFGQIEYDNKNITNLSNSKKQKFIRDHINYLFQNYALIDDDTVINNLALALYYQKKSKFEKSELIKMTLYKLGLSGYENKKIYTLSGGEQQRIALARAMLKQGNVLLADEPTGNLDTENRNIVLNNLLAENQSGKTVIIVTHDDYVANQCQRIIKL